MTATQQIKQIEDKLVDWQSNNRAKGVDILEVVSKTLGCPVADIKSDSRNRDLVSVRCLHTHFEYLLHGGKRGAIVKRINRNHTAFSTYQERHNNYLKYDWEYKQQYRQVKARLEELGFDFHLDY